MAKSERLDISNTRGVENDFQLTIHTENEGRIFTTEEIYKRISALSREVQKHDSLLELLSLTNELIKIYDVQGRLNEDPFSPTRERKISLPFGKINQELKGCVCVVTGGLGCVGSVLVNELLNFDVKSIIILDNSGGILFNDSEKIINLHCDIRDTQSLSEIFAIYKPDVVFSMAAQRDPGFAEAHVVETVGTNVLGTLNVIKACEAAASVKQMVFASTGKASRYFTEEVYAGTKKICEFVLDAYAAESRIKYSLVRFTHILDNSLMNLEFQRKSKTDNYLSIHGPGKYVTAQNAKEAAHLMLNALIYSTKQHCNFLAVSHLEWPVESLEMAIFHIKKSGRAIPVIFSGNPAGYSEKFFRGQMDWSRPDELNLLTNVYERGDRSMSPDQDIIISRVCSTDRSALERVLDNMGKANDEKEAKKSLIDGLKELVKESLKRVDPQETIEILRWGLEPRLLQLENTRVSDFGQVIQLLVESLSGSIYHEEAKDLIDQSI